MKQLQYTGDFETFFKLCQTMQGDGIGMAYNVNTRKGVAVTDVEGASRIWIKKDDVTLETL